MLEHRRPDQRGTSRDPRGRYRAEAMLATSADALKTGELADERAHERFPQPTGCSTRDRIGDEAIARVGRAGTRG
jgi:hypothetical protein